MTYDPLFVWLNGQLANHVPATFEQIEQILGFDLPHSARNHRQWWENDADHIQGKAWLGAGFRTTHVNLAGRTLVFVRSRPSEYIPSCQ